MRKGFIAPLVLIVAIFIVVSVGGVVAWRTTYLDSYLPPAVKGFLGRPVAPSESSGEIPSETSSQPEDPTKDWKSYTNSEYGLSFKYPKEWIIYQDVRGGLLQQLGNYIVDIASAPKTSEVELVYPSDPVRLRVVYVAGRREGKVYESLEEFGRIMNSGDIGELYSGPLYYQELGGKTWVKKETAEDYAPVFYTLGSNGSGYAVYIPKDIDAEKQYIVGLVVSTLRFF